MDRSVYSFIGFPVPANLTPFPPEKTIFFFPASTVCFHRSRRRDHETISMEDVANTIRLLSAFAEAVASDMTFVP
jgi:hypothetical protein